MSNLFVKILSEKQRQTLSSLSIFSRYGILAGGTGLALQLAHRYSYDFDIFCPKPISRAFFFRTAKIFHNPKVLVNTSDELSFVARTGIKCSFIFYPFRGLHRLIKGPYGWQVSFWKDIALDKAHTVGRRGEWRDYVDMYFIIKRGFVLPDILREAKMKFGNSFSEKLFLS